jgi:hypothetical protein
MHVSDEGMLYQQMIEIMRLATVIMEENSTVMRESEMNTYWLELAAKLSDACAVLCPMHEHLASRSLYFFTPTEKELQH